MQKLLRRVATAERVVSKRKAATDRMLWKKDIKKHRQDQASQDVMVNQDIDRAKQAIKDDWNLGPMAPNIYYGDAALTYGAISESRYRQAVVLREKQKEARCAWLGGSKNLNLAVGDRVVLLEGPDKGKIGKVTDIQMNEGCLIVEGLNKSNVRMPASFVSETSPAALNIELPVPISAVRLVHPIVDHKTGVTRDVIINQLVHRGFVHDRISGKTEWQRLVPGLNIIIPWPKLDPQQKPDQPGDTLRIDVEERTFVPTLLRPPMPEAVLDELRNKYSRFRTRHEPEYIARLEAEEQAKADRVKLMDSMRSPLQELHRAERASKKKKGKPRLTLEMLEEIGKVIAKNRERTLQAAGVSDDLDSPQPPPSVTPPPSSSTEPPAPPPSA